MQRVVVETNSPKDTLRWTTGSDVMSQSTGRARGAASESTAPSRERAINRGYVKAGSAPPPPFNAFGRHSGIKGLLLRVGSVVSADEDGSLSKVSVSALRGALSDFLKESAAGVSVGSSSNRRDSVETPSSRKADRDKRAKKRLTMQRDAAIIKRLDDLRQGSASDGLQG